MKRFKNILYCAEHEFTASRALHHAIALAKQNQARLTIMDVLDLSPTILSLFSAPDGDSTACCLALRRQALLGLLSPPDTAQQTASGEKLSAPDISGLDITVQAVAGEPWVELIRHVQLQQHDLLIKRAPAPGELLGRTDMQLLRQCPCPVWLDRSVSDRDSAGRDSANCEPGADNEHREYNQQPYSSVLAAVDPTSAENLECAGLVMELALSMASRNAARLSVVHSWELYGESALGSGLLHISRQQLQQALLQCQSERRQLLDQLISSKCPPSATPAIYLQKGPAAQVITEVSQRAEADLIVMGTVGRTGIPGYFIGNTAESVLQTTHCSILAVKPTGFVSAIGG